jgi:hypothetical protein
MGRIIVSLIWMVMILISLFLGIQNYIDNRKQDKLIFKTIDNALETEKEITGILKIQDSIVNIINLLK